MEDYIFICPKCKVILDCDDKIEEHKDHIQVDESVKYWNEDFIINNLEYFEQLNRK